MNKAYFHSRLAEIMAYNRAPKERRFLKRGDLDGRRLWASATSDRVFQKKSVPSDRDYALLVMVDGSGSMSGPRWECVRNVLCDVYPALVEAGFDVSVAAFNGSPHTLIGFGEDVPFHKFREVFDRRANGVTAQYAQLGNSWHARAETIAGYPFAANAYNKAEPANSRTTTVMVSGDPFFSGRMAPSKEYLKRSLKYALCSGPSSPFVAGPDMDRLLDSPACVFGNPWKKGFPNEGTDTSLAFGFAEKAISSHPAGHKSVLFFSDGEDSKHLPKEEESLRSDSNAIYLDAAYGVFQPASQPAAIKRMKEAGAAVLGFGIMGGNLARIGVPKADCRNVMDLADAYSGVVELLDSQIKFEE